LQDSGSGRVAERCTQKSGKGFERRLIYSLDHLDFRFRIAAVCHRTGGDCSANLKRKLGKRGMLGKLARGTILFILMVMFATWMWSFGARDAPEPPKHRVILHWHI
jgi:hypothetical protein